jgi:hypothetical protein
MERLHGILGNMRMEVLTQSLTFLWADMDLWILSWNKLPNSDSDLPRLHIPCESKSIKECWKDDGDFFLFNKCSYDCHYTWSTAYSNYTMVHYNLPELNDSEASRKAQLLYSKS